VVMYAEQTLIGRFCLQAHRYSKLYVHRVSKKRDCMYVYYIYIFIHHNMIEVRTMITMIS